MSLRKIEDFTKEEKCISHEHNPPAHIVLSPGKYEWTCPACGHKTYFTVPMISWMTSKQTNMEFKDKPIGRDI